MENKEITEIKRQAYAENGKKIGSNKGSGGKQHITPFVANAILMSVAIIWGGGFIAGKVALESSTPQWILFIRFGLASLCMALLFFRRIKNASVCCIKWGVVLGLLQFVGLYIQLFALQYTTTAKQSFLAATYVLFTPFAAWLIFRKKITACSCAAAVLALLGIAFLSLRGSQEIQIGDFITLGFALVFSVQIVLMGKLSQEYEIISLTFFQLLSAAAFAGAAALLSGIPTAAVTLRSGLGILYLGVANTAVAFGLQNFAQKYTSESQAALILSLESVFGLLFSIWFYDAVITWQMGIGCILIFAALTVSGKG